MPGALVSLTRTDLPHDLAADHRHAGSAALGARLALPIPFPGIGVHFGVGVSVWDDRSHGSAHLRSDAEVEEMLLPGIKVRWPVRESWGITLTARDRITGWWRAMTERSEGELRHRFVIAAGFYHR